MRKIILALIGLIALASLAIYVVFFSAPAVQRDIETRARTLLNAAGLGHSVRADADGRWLLLSGDAAVREQALAIAEGVAGTARVQWREEPSLGADGALVGGGAWRTQLRASGGELEIIGDRAALDAVSNALVARISADFGGHRVRMLADSPRDLPIYWADAVRAAAAALHLMPRGEATIEDARLVLRGAVEDERQRESIKRLMVELTPREVEWRTQLETLSAAEVQAIEHLSAAECHAQIEHFMRERQVRFRRAKTSLQPAAFAVVDGVAEILRECPGETVMIGGYTDSRGHRDVNQRLSRERAETVRNYLIEKGVSADRLDARGYGALRPIASNDTAAGRAANRRIEFKVVGE